jgi:hypothetical protein
MLQYHMIESNDNWIFQKNVMLKHNLHYLAVFHQPLQAGDLEAHAFQARVEL